MPPYSAVDPCAPEAVLTSAASAIFGYSPDEPDTAAAFAAATPLISPAYTERIGVSAGVLAPVTDVTRVRWTSLHIRVVASVRITADDHPPDTDTQVSRVVAVTQHPGDEPPRAFTAYMQISRSGGNQPWLVTDLEVK